MSNTNIVGAINKARETFLEHRTKLEAQVEAWSNKLAKVDSEVRASMEILESVSLKNLVPEMYVDDPSPEVCKEQLKKANAYLGRINNLVMQHNKKMAESALHRFGYDIESMSLNDTVKASNQVREAFLAQRAKKELEVANWATKLKNVNPEVFEGIAIPEDLSLRGLVPELYNDERDIEVCKVQLTKACELAESINVVILKYVEEAERCLSEYQERISKL